LYVTTMLVLFFTSYLGYQEVGNIMPIYAVALVYLVNILVVGYFLIPAVRALYFDPRLRWWETKPRFSVDIEVKFFNISQTPDLLAKNDDRDSDASPLDAVYFGHTANFSETGLFIKSNFVPRDHDVIELLFFYEGVEYRFSGTVILHHTHQTHGFGVKFLHDDASLKRAVGLAKLMSTNGLMSKALTFGPEDTFQYWARTLLRTGRGLIPDLKKR
jgi:hypothetical protein